MQGMEELEEDFARRKLTEAIENQVADGHPREAGLVLMALLERGIPREEALWAMGMVLADHINQAMEGDQPFDINCYAKDLLVLSSDPEATDQA